MSPYALAAHVAPGDCMCAPVCLMVVCVNSIAVFACHSRVPRLTRGPCVVHVLAVQHLPPMAPSLLSVNLLVVFVAAECVVPVCLRPCIWCCVSGDGRRQLQAYSPAGLLCNASRRPAASC